MNAARICQIAYGYVIITTEVDLNMAYSGYGLLDRKARKDVSRAIEPFEIAEKRGDRGWRIVCTTCGNWITSDEQRIKKNGAHEHAFANPHGYVFHIGCFREAVGCFADPTESLEFTWFSGYAWALASCSRCGYHLGWRFRSGEDAFYGLVTDRLTKSEEKDL